MSINYNNEVAICGITREEINTAGYLHCGHVFEREAIKQWLQVAGRCPFCQSFSYPNEVADSKDRAIQNVALIQTGALPGDSRIIPRIMAYIASFFPKETDAEREEREAEEEIIRVKFLEELVKDEERYHRSRGVVGR
ncbi:MAG: hypothetical protein KGZ39_06475 [Simkania sp.]|nr:hypothetical protein [Simkania sp.]